MEDTVHEGAEQPGCAGFKWFEDGTLNVFSNYPDTQVAAGRGDKVAIIVESDGAEATRSTHAEMLAQTCRMANAQRSLGAE